MSQPTAQRLQPAFDDPARVLDLVRATGPYWPLSSYAANDAEMTALSNQKVTFSPPWFRLNFAYGGEELAPGGAELLDNDRFVAAAHAVYGDDAVVRPSTVYVNVMGPTPFAFPPHLDVPAFRGVTRADHPIWLLKVMRQSGLFEAWRTKIATAVAWWYGGPGGDFHYWPDGPEGAPAVESPPFDNVAVVADNESTFHGVAPLGPSDAQLPPGLDSTCRLERDEPQWVVRSAEGSDVMRFDDAEVRVTMSWKADVYADADEAARADAGDDVLDLDRVTDAFAADLQPRGIEVERPNDPLGDDAWIELLAATYPEGAPRIRSRA